MIATNGDPNHVQPVVAALLQKGAREGCLELSELNDAVAELALDDEQAQALCDELEARGIELSDDCGRHSVESTRYRNDELATQTTNALQLFLNEARRYPLLTKEQEIELAKAIE